MIPTGCLQLTEPFTSFLVVYENALEGVKGATSPLLHFPIVLSVYPLKYFNTAPFKLFASVFYETWIRTSLVQVFFCLILQQTREMKKANQEEIGTAERDTGPDQPNVLKVLRVPEGIPELKFFNQLEEIRNYKRKNVLTGNNGLVLYKPKHSAIWVNAKALHNQNNPGQDNKKFKDELFFYFILLLFKQ